MPVPDIFSVVSNPVRRRILEMLRDSPRAAGDIASEFDLNRPAVSEHLQVLRNAGVVTEKVQGRRHIYHLNVPPLLEMKEWLNPFELYWHERLEALNDTLTKEK